MKSVPFVSFVVPDLAQGPAGDVPHHDERVSLDLAELGDRAFAVVAHPCLESGLANETLQQFRVVAAVSRGPAGLTRTGRRAPGRPQRR
jgi:hypothetical protein